MSRREGLSGENSVSGTFIEVKSGLTVDVEAGVWEILPNSGKGRYIQVEWLHRSTMSEADRSLILGVFIHYVRNKSANTAATVIGGVKPYLNRGIPPLLEIRATWSGLKKSNKKILNQFFGTLARQGNIQFDEYHKFTKKNLDKDINKSLDPSSGALSEFEFDSLAKEINFQLRAVQWDCNKSLDYYSSNSFGRMRNIVSNKVLLSTVRRPIQISLMKWSDIIPAGASYNDPGIDIRSEVRTVGAPTLQLRIFVAKSKGTSKRGFPERYPIHLSESLSKILICYKKFFLRGVTLLIKTQNICVDSSTLLELIKDMPVFPSQDLFELNFRSLTVLKSLFSPTSTAYHASEATITMSFRGIAVTSDRIAQCVATSNRIRHTVLTRGAQEGLPAVQLARITGVTVPAARHYIDLDYTSRQEIDAKFIGNDFFKKIFSMVLPEVKEFDELIGDGYFDSVGGALDKRSCITCSSLMGRPLGCYGCPNFRAIAEANHRAVLKTAEDKLAVNRSSLINPLFSRSVEKLERQIKWVKLTIVVCDEYLRRLHAITAK